MDVHGVDAPQAAGRRNFREILHYRAGRETANARQDVALRIACLPPPAQTPAPAWA